MLTLIENTVRLTIRHSDSEPIASAAATASISRDEATGAEWLSKPAAPDDRFMAEFLRCAGESPATRNISQESLAILRRPAFENGKMRAWPALIAAIFTLLRRLQQFRRCGRPRHPAASPWSRNRGS